MIQSNLKQPSTSSVLLVYVRYPEEGHFGDEMLFCKIFENMTITLQTYI